MRRRVKKISSSNFHSSIIFISTVRHDFYELIAIRSSAIYCYILNYHMYYRKRKLYHVDLSFICDNLKICFFQARLFRFDELSR